jgi:hypothetical protein
LLFGIRFLEGKSRSAKETSHCKEVKSFMETWRQQKRMKTCPEKMATTIAAVQANKRRQSHSESHHPTDRCM